MDIVGGIHILYSVLRAWRKFVCRESIVTCKAEIILYLIKVDFVATCKRNEMLKSGNKRPSAWKFIL